VIPFSVGDQIIFDVIIPAIRLNGNPQCLHGWKSQRYRRAFEAAERPDQRGDTLCFTYVLPRRPRESRLNENAKCGWGIADRKYGDNLVDRNVDHRYGVITTVHYIELRAVRGHR